MKTVSLEIDDSIFGETEKILSRIKKHRKVCQIITWIL